MVVPTTSDDVVIGSGDVVGGSLSILAAAADHVADAGRNHKIAGAPAHNIRYRRIAETHVVRSRFDPQGADCVHMDLERLGIWSAQVIRPGGRPGIAGRLPEVCGSKAIQLG